jgi:hypothetical protein
MILDPGKLSKGIYIYVKPFVMPACRESFRKRRILDRSSTKRGQEPE